MLNTLSSVSVRESQIQYLCDPQWFRDTASRGPATIVAPESQFRTCLLESIQREEIQQRLYIRGAPLKERVDHTVAAVVHLRSLGVLTAAGCGIGSVHAVVRSNLLVEPSEVEEGEIRSAAAIFVQPMVRKYYRSAVGLVFMEWAAGLAMETSRVKSVVRNQAEAKLNQLEHDEPAETMNQLQALKRKDEPADSAGRVCVVNQSQSIVVEEDSGEAIDEPDASNSSIQSRAYLNQLLLINQSQALHIQSTWFPGAKNRRSSKAQQS
ncbi:hypothetical protein F511_30732 [Dorcoceras hygrometricum]|uniref:Uncharacterized protein n=1 Tax=Dorcoceras hygrometricum TaxID=472368 RepID=A0A2Z7AWP1_9LAMI|nr:hypothetical protein F511_30732 [Dorcoceras hygrometricum]